MEIPSCCEKGESAFWAVLVMVFWARSGGGDSEMICNIWTLLTISQATRYLEIDER